MKTKIISRRGHRQWSEEFLSMIGSDIQNAKTDKMAKKFIWNKLFVIDKSSMESNDPKIKGVVQHQKDNIKIYTNGSLNPTESND